MPLMAQPDPGRQPQAAAAAASVFGVDYAWGRPGVSALKKAGVRFICRYLSHDTSGKNLTAAEARAFSDAGIWIVVVWESGADRALDGRAAGAADARAAAAQAKDCGMPDGRPIYFAVDWDASAAQQPAINAYLDGAAEVLGRERVGLYGGYGPVKRALDAGKARWAWQTYAWSGGRWYPRAQLQQYSNDHTINGVGLDYDRATTNDFGQWRVGVSPIQEDDVTPQDIKAIADAVVDEVYNARGHKVKQALQASMDGMATLIPLVQQIAKTSGVDQVNEQEIVAGILAALTPQAIAEAVVSALPTDLAHQVIDELSARLTS